MFVVNRVKFICLDKRWEPSFIFNIVRKKIKGGILNKTFQLILASKNWVLSGKALL